MTTKEQETHRVRIELSVTEDEAGEAVASFHTTLEGTESDALFVSRGDRVEWTFRDGPWVVRPGPISPFGQVVIRGEADETRGATVREDADLGDYKSLIAVYVDGRVHAADPHFVIA